MPWSSNATFLVEPDGRRRQRRPRRCTSRSAASGRCGTSRPACTGARWQRGCSPSTWGGVSCRRPCCARTPRSVRAHFSCSSPPTSRRTTSRSTRPARTSTTSCKAICAFDLLINNTDRKGGHCLLGLDGRVWAIDNGLCFAEDDKLRTVIWEFGGEPVPPELLTDVRRLAECVPLEVAALLDDDEVGGPAAPRPAAGDQEGLPDRRKRPPLPLAAGLSRWTRSGSGVSSTSATSTPCSARWRQPSRSATGAGCCACATPAGSRSETGRQLWPAAAYAEYRLALDGPGDWAGQRARRRRRPAHDRPALRGGRLVAHLGRAGAPPRTRAGRRLRRP